MKIFSGAVPFPLVLFGFFFLVSSCSGDKLPQIELSLGGQLLSVEVAGTRESRARGLKHRKKLSENQGMLFVFESEEMVSFWMEDTLIPLDIAFIAQDGRVRQIESMEPLSRVPVASKRYVKYALEVNQGWFARHGVKPGDRVIIPPLP